jgi:hypothetical protein
MDAVGSGGGLNRFGAWVGQIVTFFAYSLTTQPLLADFDGSEGF